MRDFYDLSERGKIQRLKRIATKALKQYDLDVARVSLLSNAFNTIFRIDTEQGERYVLRIKVPKHRDKLMMQSEMIWMDAIHRDIDLTIPYPLATRDGDFVIEVTDEHVPEPRLVCMMSWIGGRFFYKKTTQNPMIALGRAMAKLHNHADTFQAPSDFMIKRYDTPHDYGEPTYLYEGEYLSSEQKAIWRDGVQKVEDYLQQLYADDTGLRFLHTDMHLHNVRYENGEVNVFDFDDSLWAYPIQDVGISLFYMWNYPHFNEMRQWLLSGYAQVRPDVTFNPNDIDTIIYQRYFALGNFLILSNDPKYADYLKGFISDGTERIKQWLGD